MLGERHEPRNTRRLQSDVFISAVFGGLDSGGSSGALHSGVCGGAGFAGAWVCAARERRGAAAVCERSAVEDLAVRLSGAHAGDAAIGEGVPGARVAAVADGIKRAGSQHAVAVLEGEPSGLAPGVSGEREGGGGAGIDRHGVSRRGRDEAAGGGVAADDRASGRFGEGAGAGGRGVGEDGSGDRSGGAGAGGRLPLAGGIAGEGGFAASDPGIAGEDAARRSART